MNYIALVLLLLTSCASRGSAQVPGPPTSTEFTLERLPPPAGGDAQLKVTTWNVRKLGRKTFEADDRLFEILNDTDIIAFQEVNAADTGREALKILRDGMSQKTGRKLCYALSPKASGERVEVYGFIWRNDRLARIEKDGTMKYDCLDSADRVGLAAKVADLMVREPAVAHFLFKPNARQFLLISAHLVPQNRNVEVLRQPEFEVDPLFSVTDDSTLPTLVVGDFNLGNRPTERRGDPFAVARRRGFIASLDDVRTTLKQQKRDFAKPFDNLWFRGFELQGIGRIDVFEKFKEKEPMDIIRTISDHAPVTGAYTFQ